MSTRSGWGYYGVPPLLGCKVDLFGPSTDIAQTRKKNPMIKRLDEVAVITLFVEDRPDLYSKEFYTTVFGLEVVYENADSAVVQLRNLVINLLTADNAPTLVEPTTVGDATSGARALYRSARAAQTPLTAELNRQGVALLNGPVDRPWGRRTAAFADPAGNVSGDRPSDRLVRSPQAVCGARTRRPSTPHPWVPARHGQAARFGQLLGQQLGHRWTGESSNTIRSGPSAADRCGLCG